MARVGLAAGPAVYEGVESCSLECGFGATCARTGWGSRTGIRIQRHPPLVGVCTRLGRSGFARFTNTRFSMRKEDIGNTFVHLTNVAIQKHAPGFDRSKACLKWPMRSLRLFMATRHGGAEWAGIAMLPRVPALAARAALLARLHPICAAHGGELRRPCSRTQRQTSSPAAAVPALPRQARARPTRYLPPWRASSCARCWPCSRR